MSFVDFVRKLIGQEVLFGQNFLPDRLVSYLRPRDTDPPPDDPPREGELEPPLLVCVPEEPLLTLPPRDMLEELLPEYALELLREKLFPRS